MWVMHTPRHALVTFSMAGESLFHSREASSQTNCASAEGQFLVFRAQEPQIKLPSWLNCKTGNDSESSPQKDN